MELTIISIIFRVSVMYLVALAMIRISGKPSISELSTMDFVVITMLGDGLDTVIFGEATIPEGVVYLATIVLIHLFVSFLSSRNKLVFRLANSPATLMIQSAMVQSISLGRERMRPETVAWEMRLRGEDQLGEVKEAWLETNGKLSVVRNKAGKPVQKQDLKLMR